MKMEKFATANSFNGKLLTAKLPSSIKVVENAAFCGRSFEQDEFVAV